MHATPRLLWALWLPVCSRHKLCDSVLYPLLALHKPPTRVWIYSAAVSMRRVSHAVPPAVLV